jgi:hypothetical protein
MRKFFLLGFMGLGCLISFQNAFALLSPLGLFGARLQAAVGADPCVVVGKIENSTESNSYTVSIQVCDQDKADALQVFVGGERKITGSSVTVNVSGPNGPAQAIDLSGISAEDETRLLYRAFSGNRFFADVIPIQAASFGPSGLWLELRKKVVQYGADNIGDPNGLNYEVAYSVFSEILQLSQLPVHVYPSTKDRK